MKHRVGDVRPSQVMWSYGPGALIDLPSLSVLTLGINRWQRDQCRKITESRLLAAVQRALGPQVTQLLGPPVQVVENLNPFAAEAYIGMPVAPFPSWLRCTRCGRLAQHDSGLFELKAHPYRPEQSRFIHTNCTKGKQSMAVPTRFLLACRNGHLDDFPWHWFVHGGPSDCRGSLTFFETGASLVPENLFVKCESCNKFRTLAHAFGDRAREVLPACRGRHPHTREFEECAETPRTILLGATNSWFPISVSVLVLPPLRNPVEKLVSDGWEYFASADSRKAIQFIVSTLEKTGSLPGISQWSAAEIWAEVEARQQGKPTATMICEEDVKAPEWEVLTHPDPPNDWPHFLSRATSAPSGFDKEIAEVRLLERLREVNALIGFTRIETPDEADAPEERPPMAPLSRGAPGWVPANEVFGEGIFIRFKEESVADWERLQAVASRCRTVEAGHRGWRNSRNLDPTKGYPGIRYVMLHTFAHMLIRELSLECGYNTASLRERIYATGTAEDAMPMAGVLIYTAAPDSDGTLGGLVDLGKPGQLGRIIRQALSRAMICSSDPLCADHKPATDRSTHASACHACTFLPETSCERGNRYLDRQLVVPVMGEKSYALFDWLESAGHAGHEDLSAYENNNDYH